MTAAEIARRVEELASGDELPCRVVVGATGLSTTFEDAQRMYGVLPAICFVRHDGWTLGAPIGLAGVAWRLWAEDWVAVVPLPRRQWDTGGEN